MLKRFNDPAKMLLALELKEFPGAKAPKESERHDHPILLSMERERLDERSKGLVIRASVAKLVSAGVFWMAKDHAPEDKESTFTSDRMPGLSKLEEDIIRTQAQTFLDGRKYHSVLLGISDMDTILSNCEHNGSINKDMFLEQSLLLAAKRDDDLDNMA